MTDMKSFGHRREEGLVQAVGSLDHESEAGSDVSGVLRILA